MFTLAIDTSSEWGSLAMRSGSELLNLHHFRGGSRHSTTLFPALQKLALDQRSIERIIVGLGPGSFTGIRVALAAAHGLALVNNAEVVGVPSTFSVARQFQHERRLGIVSDARRGELYCTVYALGVLERETYLIPREGLEEEMTGWSQAVSAEAIDPIGQRAYPSALDYLALPADSPLFVRGKFLEPIYLREQM